MRGRVVVLFLCSLILLSAIPAFGQVVFNSPKPGEIYREYIRVMNGSNDLMVPDPNLDLVRYPQMIGNVPAPVLSLYIGDLSGAVRAEAVIVYVGGHISTVGQKMKWNDHDWIDIPLLDTSNGIPVGHHGYNYLMLHMLTMDLPLDQLVEGNNTFQGTSGTQATPEYSFGWGQWGWYAMMIRIYYGPDKPHATGRITSPLPRASLGEDPVVTGEITSGNATRMDFIAYYEDYDKDGDGKYLSYQHDYMMYKNQDFLTLNSHVGTATGAPWQATWNTAWVPDQPVGQIKMIARIKDDNDIWYVTPEVTELSLVRNGFSIKMYKPLDTPERCWAKGDVGEQVIHVSIPPTDVLSDAAAAQYDIRTWNGANVITQPEDTEYRNLNGWTDEKFGADHHFSIDARDIPQGVLQSGTNTFAWYTTNYLHHAIEILWPGPAIKVKYAGSYASPVPGMSSLAAPATGVTGQSKTLTLRWHPGLVATSYDVQVSTDSLFGTVAVQSTGVTDTSVQVGPLVAGTIYYWRVRAKSAAGATAYTTPWNFRTLALAAVPVQVAPANNALDLALAGTIRWRKVTGADTYHLQLSADSSFAGTNIVNDSTLTDTLKAFSGLAYDTPYYWRVRALNAAGASVYSSAWTFRTLVNVPGIPGLLAPANGTTGVPTTNVTFTWHPIANATAYHFQLGVDSTFTTGLTKNDSTLTDTIRVVSGLAPGMRYFWHVAAKNVTGAGTYSTTWNMTTLVAIPGSVTALLPADRATISTDSVLIRWNRPSPGAAKYTLQVSVDSTFGLFTVTDSTITDTSKIFRTLATNTTYFWHVRGGSASGWGAYSTVRRFNAVILSVQPEVGGVPTADALMQNYPNPFNPETRITYMISDKGARAVRLAVYDVFGREVALLVNERKEPGTYTARWNAAGMASGMYFYRLQAGSYSETRKLLLVR